MSDEDSEILKDRESKYGKRTEFFDTWGKMCVLMRLYAESSSRETIDEAHYHAMTMVLLKVLRSAFNPDLEDNYKDARNYITIAEDFNKSERS